MTNNHAILPSIEQLEWADAELGVIIHYDIQAFEPSYSNWREHWGYQPDPAIFNPAKLDTDQWIQTAKAAGAKYAVLVAKHCSGFSLWPTEAHDYSVKSSPLHDGNGDIVRDFIKSCEKYDIKPGLYYSTSANAYYKVDNPGLVKSGDPDVQKQYNDMVIQQVTELWSNYGKLFEIWFDGGTLPPEQGGPDVKSVLMRLQENAVCFQGPKDIPSLIRWVGNEEGFAKYPCWSTTEYTTDNGLQGECPRIGSGLADGKLWAPAEADMPNRRNQWFWYDGEDHLLLPVKELVECYYSTVGRNSNFLVGMVINNLGLVPDADVLQFTEFGKEIKKSFSNILGETSGVGEEVFLDLKSPTMVNQLVVMENIALGERIREYQIDCLTEKGWQTICQGQSIGHKRIERFETVQTSKIRLTITETTDIPHISSFAAFLA
ncbi:alpha-L-fucosidase [Bacillus sp. FSL K6-3431]|uniref:alpha-L-fucosidase n=1 Tax=Bacillus sp. FSL K6-3431 TaxID=2921500 RepID=UPI0030F5C174